jgi:predicted metal-dependent phosphoesterase TrpH
MLKADLHIHTSEDYCEPLIRYSAKEMIDYAAKCSFKVLSITNHLTINYSKELENYAKKKGIILIPGVEAKIKGKEVLVIGKTSIRGLRTFQDLANLRKEGALIIAPHPFYPMKNCLGNELVDNIDCFDAIEYSHFYAGKITDIFNKKALGVAKTFNKPVIGTSDAHQLYQMDNTYTLVDSKPKKEDIISAIKKGKVEVVTQPLPYGLLIKHLNFMKSTFLKRRKHPKI